MFKRILSLLLAFTMVFGCLCMVHAEEEKVTLKLHYHRTDGNYSGWDAWL